MTTEEAIPRLSDLISGWRKEIRSYHDQMEQFRAKDSQTELRDVYTSISAFTARAYSIRNKIVPYEKKNDIVKRFRIDEIEPLLSAIDSQFRIWSRIQALNDSEWKMNQ